jgi:hypothetical protein
VQFPTPLTRNGTFDFEIVQSPENSLRGTDSLLGMVSRAGANGMVLVEQLSENKYWGPSSSSPATDPNPRLVAYIAAARRGAGVRILLDSYYNDAGDPRGNTATCDYVNSIALAESLDLECRRANPTGTSIHNKMVLVRDGTGEGWVHTGSINGTENSNKNNRELAVQVRSRDAFQYLADVFNWDWTFGGGAPLAVGPPGEAKALRIAKNSGALVFTWEPEAGACNVVAYDLYAGDLATLRGGAYSHDTLLACSIGSTDHAVSQADPRLGNARYFFVVATNGVEEGSYGLDSSGSERPVSASACKSYRNLAACR